MWTRWRFLFVILATGLVWSFSHPVQAGFTGVRPGFLPKARISPPRQQSQQLRFDRLSLEDGLSQAAILATWQDHLGFMWFGTESGLNRYDGYNFVVHRHDPDNNRSLSDDRVMAIYEDAQYRLWLGTGSGLDRYDPLTERFSHVVPDEGAVDNPFDSGVIAILGDESGDLWVGTDGEGVVRFDPETAGTVVYVHDDQDPTSLSDNTIWVLLLDSDGMLWAGTDGGLNRLDPASGKFSHLTHQSGDPRGLADNRIRALWEDDHGRLWIGTEGGGLSQYDRRSQTFVHYRQEAGNPYSLSHDRVRAIREDSAGRLWVGTQDGLNLYDRREDRFIHLYHDPADLHSLSADAIWSLYEDRTGVLWVGTYGGGLSKYSPVASVFSLYQHNPYVNSLSDNMVWSIHEDRDGILWIGTLNGGLNRLDRETNTFTHFRHDPNDPGSISSDDVRAILADEAGRLWVGTSGGLDLMAGDGNVFEHYRHDPADPASLSDNRVTVLLEDPSGDIWVATRNGGLNRLDVSSGTFSHYRHNPDDSASLSDDRIWSLLLDRDGRLWIGTLNGIDVLDVASGSIDHYRHNEEDANSPSHDNAFPLYQDGEGVIWIGTWGGGLDRFDPRTQRFSHYTEKNGLPDSVIYSILPDLDGNLWLSTNHGIASFNPVSRSVRVFDISDGLQNNEFNTGAHLASRRGELFFGGISGFNAFFPHEVSSNRFPPPIVITTYLLFNRQARGYLPEGEHITLNYRDNFVSFEFAALDYTAPEKNQYAYMMEGLDETWVEAGARRHADYPGLSPGDYIFRVRASNNDGLWNEEGVSIYLSIAPPIWDRLWFRGLAVLLFLALGFSGYRLRVQGIEERNRQLEERVTQRTAELTQAYQELRASEERFRTVADYAHDWETWINDDGRYLYVSPSCRRVTGYEAEAFRQDPGLLISLVHPTDRALVEQHFNPDELSSDEAQRIEFRLVSRDGNEHWVEHICQPAYGAGGVRLGRRASNRDITERRRAEEALKEKIRKEAVDAERNRMARDLHDSVTQSLYSLTLLAEAGQRLARSGDLERVIGYQERLGQIAQQALKEMRLMVYQMRPLTLRSEGLAGALQQRLDAVERRAGIDARLDVEGEIDVPADVEEALFRIAQEALNNALKHASPSQVTVYIHGSPGCLDLSVSDDGSGFDPAVAAGSGGIGLKSMRERARALDSELRVEAAPGQGTTVHITVEFEMVDSR